MKTRSTCVIAIVFFIFLNLTITHAQTIWTVTGTVHDSKTAETLVGATVSVQDKTTGTVTDQQGYFQLLVPAAKDSARLIISYVGYETAMIKIAASIDHLDVTLTETHVAAREVVVTASRINETILEAPVTILKMNANAVRDAPSENFYSTLPDYKGVDVMTNSLLYKTINTRGFNLNSNFRLAQLIDGLDNSLVGLGWPLGNVLGATDLDVEKVELIPGPASALYGANAFNGLLYMTTKDPFRYQGLSAQIKTGFNHVGSDAHDPALYSDLQLRYAKAFNDRFAFKVNFGYIRGSDWLLTDSSDIYLFVSEDKRGPYNPARDAVNIYGDETVMKALVKDTNGTATDVSRTGYSVNDLIDDNTYSLKSNVSLEYKINDRLQLSYAFNFAQATTTWSSQFYLKNILMYSNKLELAGTHFFMRAAAIGNDLGDTYNASLLAGAINRYWKPNNVWFADFAKAYNGAAPGVPANDFATARSYADSGRLIPGTDAFNQVKDKFLGIPFSEGGAMVIDRSLKYYFQAEYDFSHLIKIFDLVAGADYHLTRLNSEGTIFIDEPGEPIFINQYAGYAQATKTLFKDHLKLLAALRYDKADNFKGVWAPRIAAVYHPDNQNYFRASYQNGFRIPDPQLQYMDILISATTRRLGGTAVVDAPYNSRHNSFTQASTINFNNLVRNYPGPVDSAIHLYSNLLQKSPYDYIRPEKVQTFEIGYRRLLFDENIYLDINYFHNDYAGFIYSTTLVQPDSGNAVDTNFLHAAALAVATGAVHNFLTVVNSPDKVTVDGIEAGASFVLSKGYVLSGNFTWIHSSVTPGQSEPGLRTPPFKSNVSIGKQDVIKNLGFMINWRWTDAINNFSNVSDQASIDNDLPAYSIIDAQVTYRIPKIATSIKAGASNLLNYYHQDYAQGISVGGMYYLSLLYDGIFK